MQYKVVIGYIMAIIGKLFGLLSYIYMKLANHKAEEAEKKGEKYNVYCSFTWGIGFLFVIIGSILNLVALPFCGLILFSTTVGIGIVFNNIAAILWLDEKIIWKYDMPAFILIVGSSTAIVLLSAEEELEYTPDEINKHLRSTQAIVLYATCVVLMFVALSSLKWLTGGTERF